MNRSTLAGALAREIGSLERLCRLASVQQRAMVQGRLGLLSRLNQRLARHLSTAGDARQAREAATQEWAVRRGLSAHTQVDDLLAAVDADARHALEKQFGELHAVVAELRRQNFQNHQLATVSTDLVQEQLAFLVGDPAGRDPRYARLATKEAAGLRGLVNGVA